MSEGLKALLWLIVVILCVCVHFFLGSIVLATVGVTMFGVWTGSLAWTGWCGLVNILAGWYATSRIGAWIEGETEAQWRRVDS